ncbi:NADH:flavin oxidoreductase/NADH oxidase family protein [Halocynthiibacter styelae]|uniref:NADH:flavin oxidoreductase/NADH oxidase family protein n=1 Tax=Halocynthiibacter styelae TaxID=2761955 RepID=A0A8J7IF30_9RHOB|nr:NADH:flavin oxidoreductase/NADH oxidase family protein [Paenihalocynthiibacter styelae]MBI1494472.1 NADH:flavin oxidoreductase/NADH oxidase family protein [Paenihalocynthiibacter styelae]
MSETSNSPLAKPLTLPCGVILKNRIAKAAMSDSLGDGAGNPTRDQISLYERWARGGLALSIIGEVQGTPHFAEKPGNLILNGHSDRELLERLATAGATDNAQLWLQLGHAGAMADAGISTPKGPSALNLPGLTCGALSLDEIHALPAEFAHTARLTKQLGFGGVELHAAHGFLLNQFLSPLFNKRTDAYGGSLQNRMRLLQEVTDAVRSAVGPTYPVGIKLNATDQLEGGFAEDESLEVVAALDNAGIDLIDISGGTYFPGAASSSDRSGSGPYFLDFAKRARAKTGVPLMVTGGFKTLAQAKSAITDGTADIVGLARALVVDPELPSFWLAGQRGEIQFPRFKNPPEGGVTAWYTMQITQNAKGEATLVSDDLEDAIAEYENRDDARRLIWNAHLSRA